MTYNDPIPDYAEVMTIDEWKTALRNGYFNQYDGHGYWAHGGYMARGTDVIFDKVPTDATHVAWFSK